MQINARMTDKQIKVHCTMRIPRISLKWLWKNSAFLPRAYTRILKVARTIADIEEEEKIQSSHVAEAIQYRNLDRKMI